MPVDTHDDIVPATGVINPNGVDTHEDIQPAMGVKAYSELSEKNEPSGYLVDNPGGSWLRGKQEDAYRGKTPTAQKGLLGSTTAYAGHDKPLMLPVSELSKLRGVNDETRKKGDFQYDDLAESVAKHGYTNENPVMVFVNHKGQAFINEGNTRIAVARDNGISHIKSWVHWFNGAEDAPGKWTPSSVAKMEKTFRIPRASGGAIDYPTVMTGEAQSAISDKKALLKDMSPEAFLKAGVPLEGTPGDKAVIGGFKRHIKRKDHLGPLKIYKNKHVDGRHRATAAKELGIEKVPVIDYRDKKSYGGGVPSYIPEERIEDLARRLITFSYAVAPLVPRVKGTYAEGGAVDDAQNAVDVARNLTPMGFYSAAAEAASKIPQKAPIDQIINKLKGSPNVKGEELDWSGVRDAFGGQKSVDPAQVAQHLQANLPQIQETVYGYDSKTKQKTPIKPRYQDYSTPGGQNYREVLLHLPASKKYSVKSETGTHAGPFETEDEANKWISQYGNNSLRAEPVDEESGYQSSHWSARPNSPAVKNVIAHLRLTDRGSHSFGYLEALHMEELQSDWGQEGRDTGFMQKISPNLEEKVNSIVSKLDPRFVPAHARTSDGKGIDKENFLFRDINHWKESGVITPEEADSLTQYSKIKSGIGLPSAPHVTTNEGWTDLGLKRALLEAAKGKYKKLTWTPGEEQADRYGLDKSFSEMHYSPDSRELFAKGHEGVDDIHEKVHPEALHSFIGKELAAKLLDQHVQENKKRHFLHGDTIQSLSGNGLKMEQKGMRDFYDRFIPNRLQKLVSKLDPEAKVQLYGHKIDVPGENLPSDANDWKGDEDDWEWKKVHSLEITPKLRAAILKGLPAYADGGDVGYDRGGSIIRRALDVVSNLPR